MARFTDAERNAIFEQSRRILADEPKAPEQPAQVREVPEPSIPDALELWKKQADEADARRAEAKRERLRQEREDREALARARALDGAEARITALEGRMDEVERQIAELSGAVGEFSNAVNQGVFSLDKQLEMVSTKLNELHALEDIRKAAIEDIRKAAIDDIRRERDGIVTPLIRKERAN